MAETDEERTTREAREAKAKKGVKNSKHLKDFTSTVIEAVQSTEETDNIMSDAEFDKVLEGVKEENKLEGDAARKAFIDLIYYCGNNSSSYLFQPAGQMEGCEVTRTALTATIRRVVTLRAFCAFFARVYWNNRVKFNNPPSNWQEHGVTFETRFAGFDFFHGVLSSASLQVDLVRLPSAAEVQASRSVKQMKMYHESMSKGLNTVTFGEVTSGRQGIKPDCPVSKAR